MDLQKVNGKPTIDVALVVARTKDEAYAIDTSSKIQVEPQTETTDAIKLVKKSSGTLLAQKPQITTITGHKITWTDNIFIPQVVVLLQGGTYTDNGDGTGKYVPPVVGSKEKGKIFDMECYSANYDESGEITGYEKITYPNCQGVPVTINSEDNVFRIPEYTVNSMAKRGQAPYTIEWVKELPEVEDDLTSGGGEDVQSDDVPIEERVQYMPDVRADAGLME